MSSAFANKSECTIVQILQSPALNGHGSLKMTSSPSVVLASHAHTQVLR